jgi:hypothetical protein
LLIKFFGPNFRESFSGINLLKNAAIAIYISYPQFVPIVFYPIFAASFQN